MEGIYQQTCDGLCSVAGAGSPAYDEAYFEINYVRAYTTGPPLPSATPSSTSTASATVITNIPTGTGGQDGDGDSNSASRRIGGSAGMMALVGSVLGMLLLA